MLDLISVWTVIEVMEGRKIVLVDARRELVAGVSNSVDTSESRACDIHSLWRFEYFSKLRS